MLAGCMVAACWIGDEEAPSPMLGVYTLTELGGQPGALHGRGRGTADLLTLGCDWAIDGTLSRWARREGGET